MINFIIKLEDMLKMSGYPDWEIMYLPEEDGYVLKLNDEDDEAIFMRRVDNKTKEKTDD